MPVAAVIGGETFAVYADHLNTPRKLTDRNGNARWLWAYSGFGEIGAQSLTTAALSEVRYNLRFPGQVDDGNGLFYNWHRFYHPGTGRYASADPIGLAGGWNRFGYVGGNALGAVDPLGLATQEEVDTAVRLLHGRFPEVLPMPNSVVGVPRLSGTLGQMLAGRTDLSGNIKYNATLYGSNGQPIPRGEQDNFLQTMAHEMQHLSESLKDRIGLSTGELLNRVSNKYPSIEDIIDHNADIMYQQTANEFQRLINGKSCP